jgi:hypothetical protein
MRKNRIQAVYHADRGKVVQLATLRCLRYMLPDKGDGPKAVALSSLPYDLESMWRGSAGSDVWIVDINTGVTEKIKENLGHGCVSHPAAGISGGTTSADSSWYAGILRQGKRSG